jgi:NADP-dependent 3-hydroxy acid dehydrogenase YdfG
MSPSHISGRTIVVTGAGGGFGRILAQQAAERGAKLVGCDVDSVALAATVDAIRSRGGSATGIVADVTDLGAMRALVEETVRLHGAVDVLVNNAGVMPLGFFSDHARAAEAWSRCIDINVKGVLNGMIAAYDAMLRQGRGHVVNLSSIYGNYPVAGAAVYGATKAAVNVLSEAFRVETQGRIKVTIVRPTGVPDTGLGGGIVNPAAITGILGQNAAEYLAQLGALMRGEGKPGEADPDSPRYAALAPEHLVAEILHAIDQPWGVSVGDVTVRATGDRYIL